MNRQELRLYVDQAFCSEIDHCQRKIGSLTYITVIADIEFRVSRLSRFPSNPGPYTVDTLLPHLKKHRVLGPQFSTPYLQTIRLIDHTTKVSEEGNISIRAISTIIT
jgi:hypothetical protein